MLIGNGHENMILPRRLLCVSHVEAMPEYQGPRAKDNEKPSQAMHVRERRKGVEHSNDASNLQTLYALLLNASEKSNRSSQITLRMIYHSLNRIIEEDITNLNTVRRMSKAVEIRNPPSQG